ncbi:MAG: nickel/cobalt efflux transporter RcnA [Alphaproteobacteria bacterium]|nr:nickel/cobalt efflux transporter RcnA [Alphaproteobacteria bacterium]MDE2042361.1 nickel/cobalt efflux transporter RcnA [Alphaproteobacteria bacterium]MDE2340809.1 nickel/cobalt efflux transporter RcnA [Alphaproteobacteria bacterium]
MPILTDLLQHGTSHAWLFVPTAILLGALHGLEPGHSKTMMAAFIIAIRGSVKQAVLLGLCATFSHTLIVWIIALGGLYLWQGLAPETIEPYLQVGSAIIIIGMGFWMIGQARRDRHLAAIGGHGHDHHHHDEPAPRIDTGHGVLRFSIFEDGVPPRFHIEAERGTLWAAQDVAVETERGDGTRQTFRFASHGAFLESLEDIPEPHEFVARVSLAHGGHSHDYDVAFVEHDHHHAHDHLSEELHGLEVATGYQDAHELAHANDIRRRFADRNVTTGQIIIFGLTGGLIPCPGAITVLLLCLQLKAFTLGAALVLCFSIGLALTMVTSGVIAAVSVKQVSKRFSGFGDIVRKAPYVSGLVILLIGLYLGINGWIHLPHRI